jgi:hypothetical protein
VHMCDVVNRIYGAVFQIGSNEGYSLKPQWGTLSAYGHRLDSF